ncbi:SOS response-associated peptidase family protein [Thiorhodovibrio winogradskyi]|uniref:SOS response-associated peptidase family protein n=1 Tax=Thiorhodovibrio winogradskyi TaxID=77007 RepID=UPI002E2CC61C|nr:SOS response-associated peptidase family protein [Thiorhodovibrio winogradskyi]
MNCSKPSPKCWPNHGADGLEDSATIIVTNANSLVAAVHDRMPVMLDPAHWAEWLDPGHRERATRWPMTRPSASPSWRTRRRPSAGFA